MSDMTISNLLNNPVDLRNLDDLFTAQINRHGQLTLTIVGSDRPLTLSNLATYYLHQVLAQNAHLFPQALKCMPWQKAILVWWPEAIKPCISVAQQIYWRGRGAGKLHNVGRLAHRGTYYYQGGYSDDLSLFVLVPEELYRARYRECLLQLALDQVASPNPRLIGDFINRVHYLEDEADPYEAYGLQAREEARSVEYWLSIAGPEPNALDQNDARRKDRHEASF